MADSDDERLTDSGEGSGQPTRDGSAMESLETRLGQPVDPGVELDPTEATDASEDETRLGSADAPPPSGSTPQAFATPDRYVSRGEIARGGMGAIYKVRDKDLRRSLAMKVMLGGKGSARGSGGLGFESLRACQTELQSPPGLASGGLVRFRALLP